MTQRRTRGRLRKLTHKDRRKRANHSMRTDRPGKLWAKRHIIKTRVSDYRNWGSVDG